MARYPHGPRARRVSTGSTLKAEQRNTDWAVTFYWLGLTPLPHTLVVTVCRFSLYEAGQLCVAANAAGVSPIIRVPENTSGWISRSFDAGAQAVIVPHIEVSSLRMTLGSS